MLSYNDLPLILGNTVLEGELWILKTFIASTHLIDSEFVKIACHNDSLVIHRWECREKMNQCKLKEVK